MGRGMLVCWCALRLTHSLTHSLTCSLPCSLSAVHIAQPDVRVASTLATSSS
eukprot:COSAG05_NODE_13974_length_412_cov_0.955272_1_plen_51_part_01